jgi:hypothetical protein
MSHIYGSLTLAATTPLVQLAPLNDKRTVEGHHTSAKYKGSYFKLHPETAVDNLVALPQRGKFMVVSTITEQNEKTGFMGDTLATELAGLDGQYAGSRWLHKLQLLMNEVWTVTNPAYISVIDNSSEHPSFSLLSCYMRLYLIGIYDMVNSSVRLAWTTDEDFVQKIREQDPTRYIFYRYPDVYNRPIFLHTENVCARWYTWSKTFTGPSGLLKCFNLLENFLFKNPNLSELPRDTK